jgi:hypothetical protein
MRIDKLVAAMRTSPGGIVFKKLNFSVAFGTIHLKNRIRFPISAVLAGTFHSDASFRCLAHNIRRDKGKFIDLGQKWDKWLIFSACCANKKNLTKNR